MDNTLSKTRMLIVALVWCGMAGIIVAGYMIWWKPKTEEAVQEAKKEEQKHILETTSAPSRFTDHIKLAADSFSGYAPIRSKSFKDECAKFGIRLELSDDRADYQKRLANLADGTTDMAVFTMDALIKASADRGELPATIVAMVDETKGADAMLGAKQVFPNIDSLNDPATKFVVTPNSPSETLARVVMAYFSLDRLSSNPWEYVDGASQVYEKYRQAKPNDKKVFVLWEPYTSKISANPDYHSIVGSDKFRGYIVDVLVVNRGFLVKNEALVEKIIKAYLTTVFQYRNDMVQLVVDDSKQTGDPVKKEQAEQLVNGIWWKNTQETFGHFGLTSGHDLQHMEEMIANITDVLIKTKAIPKDPTNGEPNKLYFNGIVRRLFDNSWHPGFGHESIRAETTLASLNDEEWKSLKPVGTLQVPRLVFARGTSRLSESSETTLVSLADKLKTWPQYYLVVRGNCSKDGDVQANQALAASRAKAAVDWLIQNGVHRDRIHSEASAPNGSTTVAFILGQLPY